MTFAAMTAKRIGKCRLCREPYVKRSMTHIACSIRCAHELARVKREKAEAHQAKLERQADKVRKEAIEPLEYFVKRAEKAFNAFIRKRDEGQGCISCGRHDAAVWNAGHFKSVGGRRDLRFNEDNVHLQCARPCNKDKGGNIHEYRRGLIAKIGQERTDALDVQPPAEKMTKERAKEIEAVYKAKLKALKGAA